MDSKLEPPTPLEERAMQLLYKKLHPNAAGEPDESTRKELLLRVREHAVNVEQAALDMLMRETRNPPSRGFYSKHMRLFLLVVLIPLVAIYLLLTLINWLIG